MDLCNAKIETKALAREIFRNAMSRKEAARCALRKLTIARVIFAKE